MLASRAACVSPEGRWRGMLLREAPQRPAVGRGSGAAFFPHSLPLPEPGQAPIKIYLLSSCFPRRKQIRATGEDEAK